MSDPNPPLRYTPRHTLEKARALYAQNFLDLLFHAQEVHRAHHPQGKIQISSLLSIKTGACPEDCQYCPQSARYQTGIPRENMLSKERILQAAKAAKEQGVERFCMGAAWRNPQDQHMEQLSEIVREVKSLGLETCMTLGMLSQEQAHELAQAGLDYYNHNLDTSREYYEKIITTRSYDDRLNTLHYVREAGIKICAGGILGMGEAIDDRLKMLIELANLSPPPESLPINQLIPIKGTPLENAEKVDPFDFIKIIAVARILMPQTHIRIAAGREDMSEQTQALCFMAGANSVFFGCKLLTANNQSEERDLALFRKLGLNPQWVEAQTAPKIPEHAQASR